MNPHTCSQGGVILSRGARKCLDLMRWYAARYREIYPYQTTIAKRLGIKERQLRTYFSELKNAGLLAISKQGPGPAVYQLLAEENCRSTAGLTAGLLPVKGPASITEFKSSLEKTKQAALAEFSQEQLEHPAVQAALRRARWRIEQAENPKAYAAAIIREELAAANERHGHGVQREAATGCVAPIETPCRSLAEEDRVFSSGEVAAVIGPPKIPPQRSGRMARVGDLLVAMGGIP